MESLTARPKSILIDAAQDRRYELVPQMRDYDGLDKQWLPYVMFSQPINQRTPSFSTDEYGFRKTHCGSEPLSLPEYQKLSGPKGALVGASAAFGVGATSDAQTLSSQLNRSDRRVWFNFSGRAYNSTQELLIFLLHLPQKVDEVLIFSGINHLVLSDLAEETSAVYNAFYFQSIFDQGIQQARTSGVRSSFRQLAQEVSDKLFPSRSQQPKTESSEHYSNGLQCLERDLRIWSLLRDAMGFQLRFVFQPAAPWIQKQFAQEESELFDLLDQISPSDSGSDLFRRLSPLKNRFLQDAQSLCQRFQIPFLDLNQSKAFAQPDWLFVDRVHMTDAGLRLAADEIQKEFSI